MARSFFSDQECRTAGFSPPMVETLKKAALIVDAIERLTGTETSLDTVTGQVADITDDLTDANNTIDTLDNRLDIVEAFTNFDPRYVRQDQTSAWTAATGTAARTALASYAGQTVSAGYVQAEVQAIDDAVKTLSQHLVALINDLRGNGTLT